KEKREKRKEKRENKGEKEDLTPSQINHQDPGEGSCQSLERPQHRDASYATCYRPCPERILQRALWSPPPSSLHRKETFNKAEQTHFSGRPPQQQQSDD